MPDHGRPLELALRRDLVVAPQFFHGIEYLVVKDPLSLRYHRLRREEYDLLQLVDGRRSLQEIQRELQSRYAPQKLNLETMSNFVAAMHQAGLVDSELPGQAGPLLERRDKARRSRWLRRLAAPLSIRIRGIDPTWLFDRLYPCTRWCFTRPALATGGALILSALALFAVYHAEVLERLPSWEQFFTPTNLLLLLTLTAAIKVLHEFGHGLTCRHFGGEVHELGLMFLVFAPCLYCNVSDAWRLPKRARLAIGLAGIFVELNLAAAAAFGWWLSEPGLFNQLCLGTMFVSGVSTLLINGNPLMRYDGYFVLSDLLETPNLGEKSAAVVRRLFAQLCCGHKEAETLLPERRQKLLALYAVASAIYRVVLTFSITLFLMALARPYHLEYLARGYAVISLTGMLLPSLLRLRRFVTTTEALSLLARVRLGLSLASAAAIIALIGFYPLPRRVWSPLEIEPFASEHVYVDVAGRLQQVHYRPGELVPAGSVLAQLENVDLELEIARIQAQVREQEASLQSLRSERFFSPAAARQIPEREQLLAALQATLAEKRRESARLVLKAARTGVVYPPTEGNVQAAASQTELPNWSGLPTDPDNLGATLDEGTEYCRIGMPDRWQALLVVDQTEIEPIRLGQLVEIRLESAPEIVLQGSVDEISREEIQRSPRRLAHSAGGELASAKDRDGVERPLSATYQVHVTLPEASPFLRIGVRGTARIHVAPEPLAASLGRWLSRTFHFEL